MSAESGYALVVSKAPARLLRLLSLLQVRRVWPGAELAERLGVTPRTLRRDIDRLRELGYPVEGAAGVAGGYRLGAGADLPPLSLADDEALAVSLALRTATAGVGAGIEEAALRALVKLERVLPERLRRRANALRQAIVTVDSTQSRVSSVRLAELAAACDEQFVLRFVYRAPERTTERTVEPAGLVHNGRRWYLVAFDRHREDWRTFRVDRMDDPKQGERFVARPKPAEDLRAFVTRSGAYGACLHHASVRLEAPYEQMESLFNSTAARLERIDEQSCRLAVEGHDLTRMAWWISGFGVDFAIENPPELIAELARIRDRIERALEPCAIDPDLR